MNRNNNILYYSFMATREKFDCQGGHRESNSFSNMTGLSEKSNILIPLSVHSHIILMRFAAIYNCEFLNSPRQGQSMVRPSSDNKIYSPPLSSKNKEQKTAPLYFFTKFDLMNHFEY